MNWLHIEKLRIEPKQRKLKFIWTRIMTFKLRIKSGANFMFNLLSMVKSKLFTLYIVPLLEAVIHTYTYIDTIYIYMKEGLEETTRIFGKALCGFSNWFPFSFLSFLVLEKGFLFADWMTWVFYWFSSSSNIYSILVICKLSVFLINSDWLSWQRFTANVFLEQVGLLRSLISHILSKYLCVYKGFHFNFGMLFVRN